MEDLSDYLKKNFFGLYKKKPETFGTVKERVVKMNEHRKINRHDEILGKRKIPANMSPAVTPARKSPPKKKQPPQNNKRLEMLAKWKADKEKRIETQKKTAKPVFKVSHIPITVGLPNLDNVNTEIKGKRFISKFAPLNHQFKPPVNVKPINFNNVVNTNVHENKKKEKVNIPSVPHRMTTRSQAQGRSTSIETHKNKKIVSKTKAKLKKGEEKKPESTKLNNEVNTKNEKTPDTSLMSPDFPVQNSASSTDEVKTPKKIDPPVYVSPFVTISRGKDSARKEYEARRSRKSFSLKQDALNSTSPKAGAAYFTWLLDNQISRLQEMIDKWNKCKEDEALPEEATSMIDVAIGQTTLLITKKFEQFRGLINKCQEENPEAPVTCEDLHGFWDMMHLQVNNLEKRFENLDNLKLNNWQEILPVPKQVAKKKGRPVKNAKASAGLKAAIDAARRKKQSQDEQSPEVVVVKKTPRTRRSSSRVVNIKSEDNKHRNSSSPGLMMMKIAQYAKNVETPAKSILKNDPVRSMTKSHSKTVLFQDEITKNVQNVENDLNKANARSPGTGKTPTRRSTRVTKSKLF